jgi:heptosyltransferase-3
VLEGNPDIDAIFVEPCLASWMMLRRRLPRDALVVELFLDSDRCGWTGLRVKQNISGWSIHNYYNNRNSLLVAYSGASGHPVPDIAPSLPRFAGVRAALPRAGSGARPLVAMHFTSRDPARSWPARNARIFSEAALAAGCDLIELGNEPLVASQLESINRPAAGGDVSAHLMALARADCFVGVDSGFAHCANALKIPSLILLGEFRDFPDYFPFSGPHARGSSWCIMRNNGALDRLQPDDVCAALLRLLAQESRSLEGRSSADARSV